VPSSERENTKREAKIISKILQEFPEEINGGMIAAIIVNILFRYGMYEEWEKIIHTVDEVFENIDAVTETDISEVLMN